MLTLDVESSLLLAELEMRARQREAELRRLARSRPDEPDGC